MSEGERESGGGARERESARRASEQRRSHPEMARETGWRSIVTLGARSASRNWGLWRQPQYVQPNMAGHVGGWQPARQNEFSHSDPPSRQQPRSDEPLLMAHATWRTAREKDVPPALGTCTKWIWRSDAATAGVSGCSGTSGHALPALPRGACATHVDDESSRRPCC